VWSSSGLSGGGIIYLSSALEAVYIGSKFDFIQRASGSISYICRGLKIKAFLNIFDGEKLSLVFA